MEAVQETLFDAEPARDEPAPETAPRPAPNPYRARRHSAIQATMFSGARNWRGVLVPYLTDAAPWPAQAAMFALLAEAAADKHPDSGRSPEDRRSARRVWREARQELVQCNLGLAYAVLQQEKFAPVTDDKLAESIQCVGKAVDCFDLSKEVRFSTYCTRAVENGLRRTWEKERRYAAHYTAASQLDDGSAVADEVIDIRELRSETETTREVRFMLRKTRMTKRERLVLRSRFGIWHGPAREPMTLDQIGRSLGLSKEMVRQIQDRAMDKFRKFMISRQ